MAIQKSVKIVLYSLAVILTMILIVFLISVILNKDSMSFTGSGSMGFILMATLSSLFLLVSFYLGYMFVRAMLRFLGNLAGFSGDKIPIRLVSLGLVAMIFPHVVKEVIVAPVRFFINFISYFIMSLHKSYRDLVSIYDKINFQQFTQLTLNTLADTWNSLSNFAIQLFNDLQIPNLVIAIAFWIIIGQILSYLLARRSNQSDSRPMFINFIQRIHPTTRKDILLTLIFIISVYLIMASIIAVPWLQEVSGVFKENWEKQLKEMTGTRDSFYTAYGDNFSVSPLDTLSDKFLEEKSKLDTMPQWNNLINNVRNDRNDILKRRGMIIEDWKAKRDDIWKRKENLLNLSKTNLLANVSGLGPRDQAYYYQELSKWLSENFDMLDKYLSTYRSLIIFLDSELETWVKEISTALNHDFERIRSLKKVEQEASTNIYFETTSIYNPSTRLFITLSEYLSKFTITSFSVLPEPPKPGSQWGIFGFISSWLLRANSYALILITGMLGFGLFGSLISSVVSEYSQRQKGEPLIRDLASAVIRGLSAAVVVFLSVKGGLAVFTTEEVEPNAYVLFFTCLVGAVFSENIWKWARKWLGEKFSVNTQVETDKQNHPSEQNNAQTGPINQSEQLKPVDSNQKK